MIVSNQPNFSSIIFARFFLNKQCDLTVKIKERLKTIAIKCLCYGKFCINISNKSRKKK